jgi:replicative DNA helicase
MNHAYTTGAELLSSWFADVEHGEPPIRYTASPPFSGLDVRPGRLILFGGAPGSGKTAALLQISIELLRLNPAVKLLMANVEMAPALLMERIVSRLSAVSLSAIADRMLTADQLGRVKAAADSLAPVAGRLAFLHAPFALEHVAAAGTAFGANVLVLDYIQRFTAGDGRGEKREQLETAATILRRFCDAGAVVLAASAVARQKHKGGSTYCGLNLASFRGSSELEYGADAAYLLVPTEGGGINFQCEKNRYGPVADIPTAFNATTQKFMPAPSGLGAFDAVTPAGAGGDKGRRGKPPCENSP